MIRLPLTEGQTSATQSDAVMSVLKAADATAELRRVEFVGPQVGQELLHNGLMALLFVVIGIMVYLGVRFEWKFAVAGVIANLHDVVIILGDRKSVVQGKSVSVRVDLGGRRIIKKKTKQNN